MKLKVSQDLDEKTKKKWLLLYRRVVGVGPDPIDQDLLNTVIEDLSRVLGKEQLPAGFSQDVVDEMEILFGE
jgi:hypothetical protein